MPDLPPIPIELWLRLKALDRRCNISMWREDQWLIQGVTGPIWSMGGPPSPYRRAWRCRIRLRGTFDTFNIIDTAEPLIAEALRLAAEQAERKGWHEPRA